MDLNLELYKVFYRVVMDGSISKAAQKLFISQPAVSQSIRQLEQKLGGTLLFRTPKGIKLTTEGEALFKYIEPAINFINSGEKKFSDMRNLTTGEINIGASDMTCKYYLLPYLEEFHKSFPGVRLHVTNGATPETIGQLKKGSIDFGVISLPVDEDESLVIRECMQIQDCFIAGDKYREKLYGKAIPLSELCSYPILLLEKSTTTRKYIDDFAAENGCRLNAEIELATSDLLVQFARRELGISCVVRNFAEEELEKGSIFEIETRERIPPRNIGLVMLKNVYLSAAAQRFVERLGLE